MSGRALIRSLQTRSFAVTLAVIALIVGLIEAGSYEPFGTDYTSGLVFSSVYPWISVPYLSFIINYIGLSIIALSIVLLNRKFKILKSNTWYYVGLFFMMEICFPEVFLNFSPSTVLALVLFAITICFFAVYGSQYPQKAVFTAFFILSLSGMWVSSVLFFLPAIIFGVWQLRELDLKSIIAIILGIITPFWIVWGFEWAPPFILNFPSVEMSFTESFLSLSPSSKPALILLLFIGIIFMVVALIKILNYNSSRRAFNGYLVTFLLFTFILILVDPVNLTSYLTILCILVSVEIAHVLSLSASERSWVWMAVFPSCFFLLSLRNLL